MIMTVKYLGQVVFHNMNKYDYLLVFVLIVFSLYLIFSNKSNGEMAAVYYENKEILRVSLSKNAKYKIKGYNGEVVIEVKNNSIGVVKETSPKNICSKMGFISKGYQSLVCLPNKIIIKIVEDNEVDLILE